MASASRTSPSPSTQSPSNTDTPASKRPAPEEEVQFVSSKPVKKRRTSLPNGPKPAASQQPDTTEVKGHKDPVMDQIHDASAPSNHERPSIPSSEAPMTPAIVTQGTLTPGMECFTFPQAQYPATTLPPHNSPVLSPKQLPLEASGSYSANIPMQQTMDIISFPDLFNPADFEGLGNPWELANWVPQPALMTPEAALNHRMLNPPSHLQPDAQALGPPSDYPMTLPSSMSSSQFCLSQTSLTDPSTSNVQQPQMSQDIQSIPPRETSPREEKEKTPPAPLNDAKPETPETPAPVALKGPATSEARKEIPLQSQGPHKPKLPCLICAKLRQQAMINQANGKGLNMDSPATTTAEHHFHLHSSHQPTLMGPGSGNVPGPASQMSFQYLNSPMGMMYANGVAPVNGALRPVSPYIMGGVLAQATNMPGANSMMAPAVQYTPVHNLQNTEATKRQNPGPAKKSMTTSSPAGKARAPAASKRKPPPNLIVDVAETCEEVFPFDEVAERHSVPRHRVVEVFSAIVQLPLLRCATDKRRSGKLAQTRMREFAKAKKESQVVGNASALGKHDAAHGQAPEKKLILPGVMELARNMPPLEYPGGAKQGFTGPW